MSKLTAIPSNRVWHASILNIVLVLVCCIGFASLSDAAVLQKRVNPPTKLPSQATSRDIQYQPALGEWRPIDRADLPAVVDQLNHFDTDSCYNVPAIDANGYISEGLPTDDLTSDCRDAADLDNSNVYSRQRCNSGWCAYMYGYYFEKDYNGVGGHRHDWEHILVYVPDDPSRAKRWVCASAHGEWECQPEDKVRWHNGDHPKIVYHKHGGLTHAFRFASEGDENIENHSKAWRLADLVSWEGFPSRALRTALEDHDFGSATFALTESSFSKTIRKSLLSACTSWTETGDCTYFLFPYDFNEGIDENGSPGCPPQVGSCQPPPGPEPPITRMKAMIIGDSITQGYEGDYTWRYRLSQWLDSQSMEVEYVGPWTGTYNNPDPSPPKPPRPFGAGPEPPAAPRTSGEYAGGVTFSSAHWAHWGRQAAQVKPDIYSQVIAHSPDTLLIMLGFNDLGWWVTDASGLVGTMREIVDEARRANSNIRILLANVISRTALSGREDLVSNTILYNSMMKNAVPAWSSRRSEIELVDVNSVYSCGPNKPCPAAYDGLHPGPLGEYQIARAFSEALIRLRIGQTALSIPDPIPNGKGSPAVPGGLSVTPAAWGISINWNKVFGATGYQLRWRLKGGDWASWPEGISWGINRWDSSWVESGQEWQYEVRAAVGDSVSAWSGTASGVARPTNPKGPKNIWTEPRGNSIFMQWDPVPGAVAYEIMTADQDAGGIVFPNSGSVVSTSVTFSQGLVVGHRHTIAVMTWVSTGAGWPSVAKAVRVGSGRPGTVQNLQVVNQDPTTVMLSWPAVAETASYQVWTRNFKSNGVWNADEYSVTLQTSLVVAFLFPGTWNFEFYVVALNGDLAGGKSNTVRPPVFPGWEGK